MFGLSLTSLFIGAAVGTTIPTATKAVLAKIVAIKTSIASWFTKKL